MTKEIKKNIIDIIIDTTTNTKSEIKKVLNPNSNFYRNPPYPIFNAQFPKDTYDLLGTLNLFKLQDAYSTNTVKEIEKYLIDSGEVIEEETDEIEYIAQDYIDEIPLEEVIEVLAKKYNIEKEVDKWLNSPQLEQ